MNVIGKITTIPPYKFLLKINLYQSVLNVSNCTNPNWIKWYQSGSNRTNLYETLPSNKLYLSVPKFTKLYHNSLTVPKCTSTDYYGKVRIGT